MAMDLPETDGGYIPGDLMVDILLRIPSRPLLRLKSVCKSWSNLITHPQFTSNHVGNQQHMIVFSGFDQFYMRKFVSVFRFNQSHAFTTLFESNPKASQKRDYPRTINFRDFFKEMVVCGSINGVICLSSYHTSQTCSIVLWNPTINKWKPIPFPVPQHLNIDSSIGFGFDYINDDYKIIMHVSAVWGGKLRGSRIKIYSTNQDSWEEVDEGDVVPFWPHSWNCNVIVKGVPYWKGNNMDLISQESEVIGAFDTNTGLCKEVRYPVHLKNNKTSVHLVNLMDSLAVLIYSPGEIPDNTIDVYAVDENPGTWIKKFATNLVHLPVRDNICVHQCFEEAGEIIVVFQEKNNYQSTFLYELKANRVLDHVANIGIDACHPRWDESYRHVESLVFIRGMEPLGQMEEGTTTRTGAGSRSSIGRPIVYNFIEEWKLQKDMPIENQRITLSEVD